MSYNHGYKAINTTLKNQIMNKKQHIYTLIGYITITIGNLIYNYYIDLGIGLIVIGTIFILGQILSKS